ncbi:hypothetical protein ACWEN3_04795 [Streptomyces sp. NPDC004561]
MDGTEITIKLTPDEALVLSDWLERVHMTDLCRLVDDPAAWAPIHKLPGIFAADYAERLDAARRRLRETMGSFAEEQDG